MLITSISACLTASFLFWGVFVAINDKTRLVHFMQEIYRVVQCKSFWRNPSPEIISDLTLTLCKI